MRKIYAMVVLMWLLILSGGGVAVVVLGPLSIPGDDSSTATSVLKAAVAIGMVVAWVVILSKVKNWIFQKEIGS